MNSPALEVVATDFVYRNPAPHLRAIHAWHPSLALLSNGTLVSTFDLGQAVESFDYRTYLARSEDHGQSWSAPKRICHDPDPRRHTHSIRVGRLQDDSLFGIGGRFLRAHDDQGLVNRANLGYAPMELFTIRSHDGGQTWTSPTTIQAPLLGPSFEVAHRVFHHSDGRLLAPLSLWKGWQGEAPHGMKAIALVSHDQGQSWPAYLNVMDAYAAGLIHWEQSMVELAGGGLLSVAWVVRESTGETLPTRYALAGDGRTFSEPQENGLQAQTIKIIATRGGRVVGLYRHALQSGLWGVVARIDGERWITEWDGLLWQGPAYARRTGENAADDLSGLKLGYPSMVELPSGEIFAVFWLAEDCTHCIRWMRLRVS